MDSNTTSRMQPPHDHFLPEGDDSVIESSDGDMSDELVPQNCACISSEKSEKCLFTKLSLFSTCLFVTMRTAHSCHT